MVRTHPRTRKPQRSQIDPLRWCVRVYGDQRKNEKTIAATPVAPRTWGTTIWPTPLLDLAAALLAAELGLTVDAAAADVPEGCVADLPEAVGAAPDAAEPLISAWIEELKVPVMPVRVNLAENASSLALIAVWLGSFRLTDVNLMK